MIRHRTLGLAALLTAWMALSSCGGGGGGGGSSTHPVSGAYGWVVHQQAALQMLSLVHPSQPDFEYRFTQRAELGVGATAVVSSGTVNNAAQEVTAIQPHTLVFIAGQAVRSVSLQADGSEPVSRPPVSGSASACEFLMVANDYANPLNSRFVVTPVVPTGDCSFDPNLVKPPPGWEGNSELRFSASGELVATPLGTTFETPVGVLRDPNSLAPRAWLYPDRVVFWNEGAGTSVPLGSSDTRVIASTDRSAILRRQDGGLSLLDFPGGTAVSETPIDLALTARDLTSQIGYDADAYYLISQHFDESDGYVSWAVLKIARSNAAGSVLATGLGGVGGTSFGKDLLYLNVGSDGVLRIRKAGGPVSTAAEPGFVLFASPSGEHLLVLNDYTSGGSFVRSRLKVIDENDNTLYSVDQALLPFSFGGVSTVEAASLNFGRSNNQTQFLFAATTALSFADATLTAYDTTTRRATALGRLPGAAEYGAGTAVLVNVTAGPGNTGVGFAAPISPQGGVLEAGSKVFTFDLATPNSLRYTQVVK